MTTKWTTGRKTGLLAVALLGSGAAGASAR